MIEIRGEKMKVAIDNGHGIATPGKRTPPFPTTRKVIHEWEFNHPTALKLAEILKADGHEVLLVSNTQADTSLQKRVSLANTWGADLFVSIHYNANKGVWGAHGGTEVLYAANSVNGKRAAQIVQEELIKALGWRNRGAKPRTDLYVLNRTNMPAILPEVGFMDNLAEASPMLEESYHYKSALAIAKGINRYFNYTPRRGTPIKSTPSATILQAQEWARNKQATVEFTRLAGTYFQKALTAGINPIVAYAQAAIATELGELLTATSNCNPINLKQSSALGILNQVQFNSWNDGIQAHIDVLAVYAGVAGYEQIYLPYAKVAKTDFNSAKTVEELGGTWSTHLDYGMRILSYMREIERTKVPIQVKKDIGPIWRGKVGGGYVK